MGDGTGEFFPVAMFGCVQRRDFDEIFCQKNPSEQYFDQKAGPDKADDPEAVEYRTLRCAERSEFDEDFVEIWSQSWQRAEQRAHFIFTIVMLTAHDPKKPGEY